jgi:nitric oxide reductase subunit B
MSSSTNGVKRRMVISSLWLQVAIVTFLAGFAVLLYLAYRIHAEPPPIPGRVVAEYGSTLFTGDDIMAGQHIFQQVWADAIRQDLRAWCLPGAGFHGPVSA